MFQSTPPRGGRLKDIIKIAGGNLVSIHAPARGATFRRTEIFVRVEVSIHAPARGATPHSPPTLASENEVSIHAPARGATRSA